MTSIVVNNSLGMFKELNDLGITNFFTCSNAEWGSMKLPLARNFGKYQKIFHLLNIKSPNLVLLAPDHNDNVHVLTKENLIVYGLFNKDSAISGLIRISSDGIITKEKIPLVVTPADCVVVAICGVDLKDKRKFVILLHCGFTGTILQIVKKAIKTAHAYYDFCEKNLSAFVFPYIDGKHYVKELKNNQMFSYFKKELDGTRWKSFLKRENGHVEIDFGERLVADLTEIGIGNISSTGIDTYTAHEKGLLYSHVFAMEKRQDKGKRFAVGVSLNS